MMTPKERAVAALTLEIPDQVPTFELEFQLEEEMFGKSFLRKSVLDGKTELERDRLIKENAEYMFRVYEELEYSIIPIHYISTEDIIKTIKYIRQLTGDKFMLTTHGDGTFSVLDGESMYEFVYSLADNPDDIKELAKKKAETAVERNKKLAAAGLVSFSVCDDYCFTVGTFLLPTMFAEFIQPYLYKIVQGIKAEGAYAIKHTDGNIMPILDQLVECEAHALHSIDPMAGVDIKEVKEKVGDKICLCGNVNCALLQTGTEAEVIASAEYCLTHAKPGGGYIYSTSNIPFKGLDPERYQLVLDVWKKMRKY